MNSVVMLAWCPLGKRSKLTTWLGIVMHTQENIDTPEPEAFEPYCCTWIQVAMMHDSTVSVLFYGQEYNESDY